LKNTSFISLNNSYITTMVKCKELVHE